MASYSGYIVASENHLDVRSRELEYMGGSTTNSNSFVQHGNAYGARQWREFLLTCSQPLADETEVHVKYTYPVVVINGYGKLIILANRRRIVDFVLLNILDEVFFPSYRKVNVYVDRLIEACSAPDNEFLVTSLHGRFSGPSRDLKSISLYGDNITNSGVYSGLHELFNFHSCGVGRRLFDGLPKLRPNEEGEIVRISNDGFVTLNVSSKHHAQELIHVVNHIVRNRWIDEWVPGFRDADDD